MKPAPQQIIRESPLVSHGFIRGAAFVIVRTIVRDERLVIPFKVLLCFVVLILLFLFL